MELLCLEKMNLFHGLSMVNNVVFMCAYPLGKARVCSVSPTEILFFVRLILMLECVSSWGKRECNQATLIGVLEPPVTPTFCLVRR
ncbi:hypothetical protein Y032_0121g984 [Ancylostoma ceylanicum]|uniref:Uncharacterized protein n=1 Tax=Ancylostoma ceylanicum TaxID=53326 RepID=A0A016TAF3_9BILA|nr:hypothetical protein Y032_0121g984 [Ancylostoma ceylanicum]